MSRKFRRLALFPSLCPLLLISICILNRSSVAQVSIPSSDLVTPDKTLSAADVTAQTFLTDDAFNVNPSIRAAIAKAFGGSQVCLGKYEVLVVHFARWTTNDDQNYRLHENLWNFYHASLDNGTCKYKKAPPKANGQDPRLYRDKSGFFVGINVFDQAVPVQIAYKLSTTAETPENIKNAGTLIQALLGAKGGGAPEKKQVYVAASKMDGYKRLPFDFNFSYSLTVPGADQSPNVTGHPGQDLTAGEIGTKYSAKIPYTTGVPPFTFAAVDSHRVPAGLKIESDGTVDGTPTAATDLPASQSFEVQITDSSTPPVTVKKVFYLKVGAAGSLANAGGGAGGPSTKPAKADTGADSTGDTTAKTDTSKSKANPTSVDCAAVTAKSACTYNLSYESDDLEWWDVGMAISTPGIKETQYSVSSTNVVQAKTTTHTDVYALVDLYPGAWWKPKDSYIPHFVVGLPIAGKTFYRPAFGAGENVTSWTGLEKRNFPLRISLVGGVVYMKESVPSNLQVGATATASQLASSLSQKRVTKAWFGAEVSVNALVSKIKK